MMTRSETRAAVIAALEKKPMTAPELIDSVCTGPQESLVRSVVRDLLFSERSVQLSREDWVMRVQPREQRLESLLRRAALQLEAVVEDGVTMREGSTRALVAKIREEL